MASVVLVDLPMVDVQFVDFEAEFRILSYAAQTCHVVSVWEHVELGTYLILFSFASPRPGDQPHKPQRFRVKILENPTANLDGEAPQMG